MDYLYENEGKYCSFCEYITSSEYLMYVRKAKTESVLPFFFSVNSEMCSKYLKYIFTV